MQNQVERRQATRQTKATRKPIETVKPPSQQKERLKERVAKFRSLKKAEREAEQLKKEAIKEKEKLKKRRKRAKLRTRPGKRPEVNDQTPTSSQGYGKSPRSVKRRQRSLYALKKTLPRTPGKRAECVEKLANSPSVKPLLQERGVIHDDESRKDVRIARALITDMRTSREAILKDKSSEAAHMAETSFSMAFGSSVKESKLLGTVQKKLNINKNTATRYSKFNVKRLQGSTGTWKHTGRKTRSDAISQAVKQKVVDFWSSSLASHVTGNKNDIKRVRLGPKEYAEHPKMILEKRQTDVFNEFCSENPDIKMHQRTFEKLKPYYVFPCTEKDRNSCCCRNCIEGKMVCESAMKFRKKLNTKHGYNAKTYDSIGELVADTMCKPPTLKCIERKCPDCGVNTYELLAEEKCDSQVNGSVKWSKYEYKECKTSKGGTKKKLILSEKETSPAAMTDQLLQCIHSFAKHERQFTL